MKGLLVQGDEMRKTLKIWNNQFMDDPHRGGWTSTDCYAMRDWRTTVTAISEVDPASIVIGSLAEGRTSRRNNAKGRTLGARR